MKQSLADSSYRPPKSMRSSRSLDLDQFAKGVTYESVVRGPPKEEHPKAASKIEKLPSAYENYIKKLAERREKDEAQLHEMKKKQFSSIMGIKMDKLKEAIPKRVASNMSNKSNRSNKSAGKSKRVQFSEDNS